MDTIYEMPGHLIRRLQQISVSIFSSGMKEAGFDLTSPQFAALTILDENPGIDQATLAGMIALDRPTIGGVLDRLVAKGLVERHTNKTDRRAKRLTVTSKGKETVKELRPVVLASQQLIMSGLSPEEAAQFISLAEKLALIHNDRSRAPLILPKNEDADV